MPKFLVFIKPGGIAQLPTHAVAELVGETRKLVEGGLQLKAIDYAYSMLDGRSAVIIANANSHEELLSALMDAPLYPIWNFDIHPLADFAVAFEKNIRVSEKLARLSSVGERDANADVKDTIRRAFEDLNQGRLEHGERLFGAAGEEFRMWATEARKAFPDLQVTVEDIFGERDEVVVRWTARGNFRGEATHPRFGRLKPTGKPMTVTGITILRIANNQIVESWGEVSEFDVLEQLGLRFPMD
jgi:predicted ester cyclase